MLLRVICVTRRLEKNNLGFSTCFFGHFELHFVQDIIKDIFPIYKTNMWLKKAKKLTKYIGNL